MVATEKGNIITYSDTTTSECIFYQPYDFVGYSHIQGLYPKLYGTKWNKKTLLFIVVLFKKVAAGRFNYGNKFNRAKAREFLIYIPTKNGEIDFEFMESFVAELETQCIAELEAYLLATGLKDYELTKKEEIALEEFTQIKRRVNLGEQPKKPKEVFNEEVKNIQWSEYRLGDLFEKLDLKFKKKKFDKSNDISRFKTKEYNLPLVNAKHGDNGIMYYGRSKDFDSATMTIDIVNDGAISTGDVYPQPQETGVLYNAYLISPRFKATVHTLYFFSVTIEKSIKLKFGYENKAVWEKVKDEYIQLPTKNGEIDFEFMEILISAVQKLVIKDVVLYAGRKIETTREVIERDTVLP